MGDKTKTATTDRVIHAGMLICCGIMVAPLVLFLLNGGAVTDILGNIGLLLPLVVCLGAHFLVHRFMGVSCHKEKEADSADDEYAVADVQPTPQEADVRGH